MSVSAAARIAFFQFACTGDSADDTMRVTRYLRPLNYGLARGLRQGRFDALWVHGYARIFNGAAMLAATVASLAWLLDRKAA